MRTLCKIALVLGLVALVASPALAQRPMGGGGFGGGYSTLLQNKSVQDELKIEADQLTKVTDALKKVADDNKDLIAKSRDRQTPREERAEITKKLNEASLAGVKDVLKEDQVKRLKQISFQQTARFNSVGIYLDPEVQKTVKLTETQVKDIKTINDEVNKERPQLGGGGGGQEAFQKFAALQKEASEKVTKMLTDEQKKAYEELAGKPFEVRQAPRPPQN